MLAIANAVFKQAPASAASPTAAQPALTAPKGQSVQVEAPATQAPFVSVEAEA
jgi:hypothetical protein